MHVGNGVSNVWLCCQVFYTQQVSVYALGEVCSNIDILRVVDPFLSERSGVYSD